jgi:hypothetical protein
MSFTDINLVVHNIEAAQDYKFDLSAPTLHPPRVLWSHLWYPDLPKGTGAKYIYVTRGEPVVSSCAVLGSCAIAASRGAAARHSPGRDGNIT